MAPATAHVHQTTKAALRAENQRLQEALSEILAVGERVRLDFAAPIDAQPHYLLGRIQAIAAIALSASARFAARGELVRSRTK